MTVLAQSVCAVGATLGEGPAWIDDALWFVDIKQQKLHRFTPDHGTLDSWSAPAQPGWVLPSSDGSLLCGLQTGLHHFHAGNGAFTPLVAVEPSQPGNRLNDAAVDCHGRLWLGSMDDAETAPTGHIYRGDARGVARLLGGITITNGPAVSADGTLLYHVDTLARTIYVSEIDDDGTLRGTRPFVTIASGEGHPDGPVVDAEGYLWVGLWGGWSARRYSPAGDLVQTVRFPVANVTKIALGGRDGLTAYATTATKGLSATERADQPLAGNVFTFALDVPGPHPHPVGPIAPRRHYDG